MYGYKYGYGSYGHMRWKQRAKGISIRDKYARQKRVEYALNKLYEKLNCWPKNVTTNHKEE